MSTISKEEIISVNDESELRSFFISSTSANTISDDTQHTILLQCIKFGKMYVLEDLSKNVTFKPNIIDEIIEYPEMIRNVILSNGMGGFLSQLSNPQLLKLINNLLDFGEHDSIWTHLYQKTFTHKIFRRKPNTIKFILNYLIFEKNHYYFSRPQILMNIIETMDNITPELIDFIKEFGKKVDSIILNLLYKNSRRLKEDILEYIYFNVKYTNIERKIAEIFIERDVDSIILHDYYTKTGEERYLPKIAKDIFNF